MKLFFTILARKESLGYDSPSCLWLFFVKVSHIRSNRCV